MSGGLDLDIMQPDHRIEGDGADLGALAHHLLVDLARGRHVHDQVAQHAGLAAQPMLVCHTLARTIAGLDLAGRAGMGLGGTDAVLGELPLRDADLAAAAQAAPATDRIEVDPQRARRLQQRRAMGEAAALARWREHHQGLICHGR